VGDLTYLRCWEGVVFFAFILDAHSRIVGWQLAPHMRTELVLDALGMAIHQRGPGADVELVAHTDRGSLTRFNRSLQHRLVGRSLLSLLSLSVILWWGA
jgi:transposase InsO family protein